MLIYEHSHKKESLQTTLLARLAATIEESSEPYPYSISSAAA
jgi:hypothetical protein